MITSRCAAVAVSLFIAISISAAAQEPSTIGAQELANRLNARQQDGQSYIRLRMQIAGSKDALQVQIKSRATRAGTDLVYQVLFPKERKGESVLLRKGGSRISGAVFTPPDNLRTLTAAQLDEPLFGSDLSYEDVIDNFFSWQQQAIVGNEPVDRTPCVILESKPGKSEHSSYASVRTWVDVKRSVPLRIEKYGEGGRLARRILTTRVAADDKGRAIPANLTVRGSRGTVTELDGSRINHDVTFSESEFTAEGLKQLKTSNVAPK